MKLYPTFLEQPTKYTAPHREGGQKGGSPLSMCAQYRGRLSTVTPGALCPMTARCSCVSGSRDEVMCPRSLALGPRNIFDSTL